MIKQSLSVTYWFMLMTVIVIVGCKQKYTEKLLLHSPEAETITVDADYSARAIEAAGGLDAWLKLKKLDLDAVVTFYEPGGSFHLTEHHYDIYPWSNSIRVTAAEPAGNFTWLLSAGKFMMLQAPKSQANTKALPLGISERDFAETVLDIVTAPVRFIDEQALFALARGPVKMETSWYHLIERTGSNAKVSLPNVIFYQNKDNFLVDMLWLPCVDAECRRDGIGVRAYAYEEIEKAGALIPSKIEIFDAGAGVHFGRRLIKIDFK